MPMYYSRIEQILWVAWLMSPMPIHDGNFTAEMSRFPVITERTEITVRPSKPEENSNVGQFHTTLLSCNPEINTFLCSSLLLVLKIHRIQQDGLIFC